MNICRNSRRLLVLLVGFIAFIGTAGVADAAMVHFIDFQQLNFVPTDGGDMVEFSSIGRVSLAYDAEVDTEYLNIMATIPGLSVEPFWVVRNLLLHDMTVGAPYEEDGTRFPLTVLGVETGMQVSMIEFGWTATPTPVLDEDFVAWSAGVILDQAAPVTVAIVDVQSAGLLEELVSTASAVPWFGSFLNGGGTFIDEIFGCLVGNVELDGSTPNSNDVNGCVPAACANSMDWLRLMNDNVDFPGDLRETYEKLSQLMNRNGPHGVWPEDMMRAKLDFIEAHNLPIEVKYQNRFPRSSPVTSTSGHSSAVNHGTANTFPTAAWLKQEIADNEDVEMNVYYYKPGSNVPGGGHCVVVTGAGTTGGQDWIKIKHDNDQSATNPGELKQVHSDVKVNSDGQMVIPGLNVEKTNPDGTTTTVLEARVTSVISESPKTSVPAPPDTEAVNGWCQLIKRTIPPGGALEIVYPDEGEGRCYNATVWRWNRNVTPPERVYDRQWNHNKGKTRRVTNNEDYPVTYEVHNDDYQVDPYTPFEVDVNVVAADANPNSDDADNQVAYGGYSVGGNDSSSGEFAQVDLGSVVMAGPIQVGFSLSSIPSTLRETGGTNDLTMFVDIPVWNMYWEETRFVVDVLEVGQAGDLQVECSSTGMLDIISIAAPGRYFLDLGTMAEQPQFSLRLVALGGLDITLDGLGAPSLIPAAESAVGDEIPARRATLHAWPNPFNPSVNLTFSLSEACTIELGVFDLRGRRVAILRSGPMAADKHVVSWDGCDGAGRAMPAGTYVCRLVAAGETHEERVMLVK